MKENNPRNIVTQVLILLLQIKCVSGCFFYKIIKAKAFYTNTILLGKRKHFIFKNAMLCLIETVSKILWNLIDIFKKKKGEFQYVILFYQCVSFSLQTCIMMNRDEYLLPCPPLLTVFFPVSSGLL